PPRPAAQVGHRSSPRCPRHCGGRTRGGPPSPRARRWLTPDGRWGRPSRYGTASIAPGPGASKWLPYARKGRRTEFGGAQTDRSSLPCSSRLSCASSSAERRRFVQPLLLVRGKSYVGEARGLWLAVRGRQFEFLRTL